MAKAILEIAQAQYAEEEKISKRYRMHSEDVSDSGDDGYEPEIYGEIVDQHFIIENIGQVPMQVKSRVKPLDMLGWEVSSIVIKDGKAEELTQSKGSLLRHAIVENDRKSLRYYYDLASEFAAQDQQAEESCQFVVFPQWAFWLAVEHGHLETLTDMIRWTGAGLPLEQLVQKTGVELKEVPRSYQGLTVYGKKRYDSHDSPCLDLTDKGNTERIGRRQAGRSFLGRETAERHHFCMQPKRAPSSQSSGF